MMNSSNSEKKSSATKYLAPSSIVDLKAELYRKQKEYKQQKSIASHNQLHVLGKTSSKPIKKPTAWKDKNSGVEKRSEKEGPALETNDEQRLEMSRKMLEAKAKLYERMSRDGDNAEDEDGNSLYLVDFESKFINKAMEDRERRLEAEKVEGKADNSRSVKSDAVNTPPHVDDEGDVPEQDQWVEYTDSLGRTRRCMKKDLPKDKQAASGSRSDTGSGSGEKAMSKLITGSAVPDLMSADMQREMMREKWEKEQRELLETQDTVHYANVQFDEQRTHGAAYYQFSKNESERAEEMEKLNKLREDTKSKREMKDKLKSKRKAQLSARLEKVRQRMIAQGKPVPELKPEDGSDGEEEEVFPVPPAESEINRGDEPERKRATIREWDLGKDGLLLPQRPTKPKSWVNPRDQRDDDFAPPSFYYDSAKKEQGHKYKQQNKNSQCANSWQDGSQSESNVSRAAKLSSCHTRENTGANIERISGIPLPDVVSQAPDNKLGMSNSSNNDSDNVCEIPLPGEDSATKSIDNMLKSLRGQT